MATGKPTPIPIFAPVESPLGLGEGDVFGDVDEDIVAEIIVEIVAEIVAGEVIVLDSAVGVIGVGVIADARIRTCASLLCHMIGMPSPVTIVPVEVAVRGGPRM
jgi:hypothetical protein